MNIVELGDEIPRASFFPPARPVNVRRTPTFDNIDEERLISKERYTRPLWFLASQPVSSEFYIQLNAEEDIERASHVLFRFEPKSNGPIGTLELTPAKINIDRIHIPDKPTAEQLITERLKRLDETIEKWRTTQQLFAFNPDSARNRRLVLEYSLKTAGDYNNTDIGFFARNFDPHHAVFYNQLSVHRGTFNISGIPLNVRSYLHKMNRVTMVDNFYRVVAARRRELDTPERNIFAQCVKDVNTIIANGDYSCFPLNDELAECLTRIYLQVPLRDERAFVDGSVSGKIMQQAFGTAPTDFILLSKTNMTNRVILSYLGLAVSDIVPIYLESLTERPVYNIAGAGSRGWMMREYLEDQEKRQKPLKVAMTNRLNALQPLLVATDNGDVMMEAYTAAAVHAYVTKNIAKHLKEYKLRTFTPRHRTELLAPGMVSPAVSDYNFMRFSLDFDYLDTLATLAAIRHRDMAMDVPDRKYVVSTITKSLFDIINKNRKVLATQQLTWAHWAHSDNNAAMVIDAAYADMIRMNLALLDQLEDDHQEGFDNWIKTFLSKDGDLGFGQATYAVFSAAITQSPQRIEPTVNWWSHRPAADGADELSILVLADPDFHIFYCVFRLLQKLRGMDKDERVANFRIMMMQGMMFDIIKMRAAMHSVMTIRHMETVFNEIIDLFETRLVFLPPSSRGGPPPLEEGEETDALAAVIADLPSICKKLPRLNITQRITILDTFLHQMFTRRQPRAAEPREGEADMDILQGLVSGNIYNLCNYTHAAQIDVTADMERSARAAGVMACMDTINQFESLRRCVAIGGSQPTKPEEIDIVIPVTKAGAHTDLSYYVDLYSAFGSTPPDPRINVIWMWTPARDEQKRKFIVAIVQYDPATPIQTLRIPHKDGYEGEYEIAVGNDLHGYSRQQVRVRVFQVCVRTERLYEEARNSYTSAIWTIQGVSPRTLVGWNSATTMLPFLPTLDQIELEKDKILSAQTRTFARCFGDSSHQYIRLYALLFGDRMSWFAPVKGHESDTKEQRIHTIITNFAAFMARSANGTLPECMTVPDIKTASQLVHFLLAAEFVPLPASTDKIVFEETRRGFDSGYDMTVRPKVMTDKDVEVLSNMSESERKTTKSARHSLRNAPAVVIDVSEHGNRTKSQVEDVDKLSLEMQSSSQKVDKFVKDMLDNYSLPPASVSRSSAARTMSNRAETLSSSSSSSSSSRTESSKLIPVLRRSKRQPQVFEQAVVGMSPSERERARAGKDRRAMLEVVDEPGKGKGVRVRAGQVIPAGAFVIEYEGNRLTQAEFDKLDKNQKLGNYVVELGEGNNGKDNVYAVDATIPPPSTKEKPFPWMARYINHKKKGRKGRNLDMMRLPIDGKMHVMLYAIREIQAGEFLAYDYGYRDADFPFLNYSSEDEEVSVSSRQQPHVSHWRPEGSSLAGSGEMQSSSSGSSALNSRKGEVNSERGAPASTFNTATTDSGNLSDITGGSDVSAPPQPPQRERSSSVGSEGTRGGGIVNDRMPKPKTTTMDSVDFTEILRNGQVALSHFVNAHSTGREIEQARQRLETARIILKSSMDVLIRNAELDEDTMQLATSLLNDIDAHIIN
jgi:hypothetical protein